MHKTYTVGPRTFVLDRARAEAALAAKRVVGGRQTLTFNLLPLRYGWAYGCYASWSWSARRSGRRPSARSCAS
jgi:ribonucleoside-diphosphate reductase beta chain